MSFTPRIINSTSRSQIGQVIRINISDNGIFRAFYNDISGNMYSAVSRQSNFKQVVIDSSKNRTVFDVSDTALNKFINPIYGGSDPSSGQIIDVNSQFYDDNEYNPEVNDFYVCSYVSQNLLNEQTKNIGPWRYFTQLTFQNYIKQGSSFDSSSVYDTKGYSSMLDLSGKNQIYQDNSHNAIWFDQLGTGWGVSDTSNNGIYLQEIGALIPDLYDFSGQNISNAPRQYPLNNRINNNLPLIEPADSTLNICSQIYGGYTYEPNSNVWPLPPGLYTKSYYSESAAPKYIWLDANDNATSNTNGSVGPLDTYYKGRWSIWVDSSGSSDNSGNIYISRKNNCYTPVFYMTLANHLTENTGIDQHDPIDISSIYVDIDIDISRNSTRDSGNFNNIYSRPYYIYCDYSNNVFIGRGAYDVSMDYVGSVSMSTNDSINGLFTKAFPFKQLDNGSWIDSPHGCKYCKIKVNPYTTDNNGDYSWAKTRWHTCYYTDNSGGGLYYNTGIFDDNLGHPYFSPGTDTSYNITQFAHPTIPALDISAGQGLFPSLDISYNRTVNQSGGAPCIAYFSGKGHTNSPGSQAPLDTFYDYSIYLAIGIPSTSTSFPVITDWKYYLIEKDVVPNTWTGEGTGPYTDLSNNQPISLKVSPYDNSIHICYQKYINQEYQVKYWTNSKNIRDITKVDSSLNYIGIHSQGREIDISNAYVEVYWDLSSSKCVFSRDYSRYNESTTSIVGLTTPQFKIKEYISPYGARTAGELGHTYNWLDGVIYNHEFFDNIYIIAKTKTPSVFSTHNILFTMGGIDNGGYIGGLQNGKLFFGINGNVNSSLPVGPIPVLTGQQGGANSVRTYWDSTVTTNNEKKIPESTEDVSYNQFKLLPNTEYILEYYYNKSNYYVMSN